MSPGPIEALIENTDQTGRVMYRLGVWRGRLSALETELDREPLADPDRSERTRRAVFTARKVIAALEPRADELAESRRLLVEQLTTPADPPKTNEQENQK